MRTEHVSVKKYFIGSVKALVVIGGCGLRLGAGGRLAWAQGEVAVDALLGPRPSGLVVV